MKLHIVAALAIAVSATTPAFADSGHDYPAVARDSSVVAVGTSMAAPAPTAAPVATAVSQSKTREQVRQELIAAYHDGLLPTGKHDYPPSDATIARNKELHQLIEPKWAAQH
ncbi:hypothetical protein BCO18430_03363 [Burkholderia contaminans]|uniref:DUF4148 domain-containing protein n=1 Tax=Burkholderia contaminans TaxID=488447 RepID=UPI001453CB21|nr:DUF4148 domain-containing protein [Burkholderia contaminans]VWC92810.1 hypothetical protein BCO18430_03363 [Burkholderia contaminans]